MASDLIERLRKKVKMKKTEAKLKQGTRKQRRVRRARERQRKKEVLGDFASDVRELAGATRVGGALSGVKRGAEVTAKSGKSAVKGIEEGSGKLDASLDRLGVDAPEEGELAGEADPDDFNFMSGGGGGGGNDDDEDFRFI